MKIILSGFAKNNDEDNECFCWSMFSTLLRTNFAPGIVFLCCVAIFQNNCFVSFERLNGNSCSFILVAVSHPTHLGHDSQVCVPPNHERWACLVGRLSILGQRKSCGPRARPRKRDEEAETTARSRGYSFLNSQLEINTYNSPPSRSTFYSEIAP